VQPLSLEIMGFLDRHALELMAGLGALVGAPVPQTGPGDGPVLPDGDDGSGLLPPAEPSQPPPPAPVVPPGGGPPIPPPMPRSTLDNLHGTGDAPYPMPVVKDPSELGPAPGWFEVAPGIWMPPGSANEPESPPWRTHIMGWSGAGADEAKSADAEIVRTGRARGEVDQSLGQGILDAQAAARTSQSRLRQIHAEVQAGIQALRPSMNTPAGRQQMADLLQRKSSEAREVIRQAQDASTRAAAAMGSAGQGYATLAL
jgi:hypothetical protein